MIYKIWKGYCIAIAQKLDHIYIIIKRLNLYLEIFLTSNDFKSLFCLDIIHQILLKVIVNHSSLWESLPSWPIVPFSMACSTSVKVNSPSPLVSAALNCFLTEAASCRYSLLACLICYFKLEISWFVSFLSPTLTSLQESS